MSRDDVPNYREPTEGERAFLRLITRGYPDVTLQIEACQVADYDPTGWCDIKILEGPAARPMGMAQGPRMSVHAGEGDVFVEILMWTNAAGMLYSIELVEYGMLPYRGTAPYQFFVDADADAAPRSSQLEFTGAAAGGWAD